MRLAELNEWSLKRVALDCFVPSDETTVASQIVWRNSRPDVSGAIGHWAVCVFHLVNHFRPKTVDQIHETFVELAPVHLHHWQPLRERGLKILSVREAKHKAHGERVTSELPSLSDELDDTGCIRLRVQKGKGWL